MAEDPFDVAEASAAQLASLTSKPAHDIAVVLGSGWTPAADAVGAADVEVPLTELGGFPEPTVPGHTPTARSVTVGERRALLFPRPGHLYRGPPPSAVR